MSQSKREQVVSHLRYIRQELREMHQGVMDDGLLPEAGEVRGVMAQMEALLELLVAMLAIVPVFFGVAWLARMQDMQQATIAAARALAFECTVRPQACAAAAQAKSEPGGGSANGQSAHAEKFAEELRKRLFAAPRSGLRSDDNAAGNVTAANGNVLWVDRTGKPLLERFEDVSIEIAPVRFNSPFAFAGGQGERSFPGAVRLLSELGGPGRFGLDLEAGFIDGRILT
jgi:hypothetical protein